MEELGRLTSCRMLALCRLVATGRLEGQRPQRQPPKASGRARPQMPARSSTRARSRSSPHRQLLSLLALQPPRWRCRQSGSSPEVQHSTRGSGSSWASSSSSPLLPQLQALECSSPWQTLHSRSCRC